MIRRLLVSLAACAGASSLVAAGAATQPLPGISFDPTFGTSGTVRCCTRLVQRYDEVDFAQVVPFGDSTYVAGTASPPGAPVTLPLVAAYRDDGSPSPSFNQGRPRIVRATGHDSRPSTLLVRRDGRLVLAGLTNSRGERHRVFVVQLTPSGALDTHFARDGSRLLPTRRATSVTAGLDAAGRLYLSAGVQGRGSSYSNPVGDVHVWRLRRGGGIDPTYGRHGRHVVDQRRCDVLSAMSVTPRGTLTLALLGMSLKEYGEGQRPPRNPPALLVQLTPRGRVDRSFSADGSVPFRIQPRGFTAPLSLQRDAQGRLVAGVMAASYVGVRRWMPDGRPDPTFGEAGVTRAVPYPSAYMPVSGTLTPAGYLLVGFDFSYGRDTWFARFLPDGGLDPSFGAGGQGVMQLWPFATNPMEIVETVSVDPQGRLLVAGTTGSGSTSDSWAVLSRLLMS